MNEQPDSHLAQQIFGAKWIANGFPKSGTHLLAMMLRPLAPYEGPTEAGHFDKPWAGTFRDNSWTLRRKPIEDTAFRIARISNGHMVKAHLGHTEELARFIYLAGAIHVFVYRDLRDVAVSQAHHIIGSDSERLAHPAPDIYTRDDFDTLLLEVIRGHKQFPGLVDRWEQFAPWIEDDWTYAVKYEELMADRKGHAQKMFSYAMERMGRRFGVKISLDPLGTEAVVSTMVAFSERKDLSPTFRRGEPGNWRESFRPEHVAAFNETGGGEWLVKLGYEDDSEGWYE